MGQGAGSTRDAHGDFMRAAKIERRGPVPRKSRSAVSSSAAATRAPTPAQHVHVKKGKAQQAPGTYAGQRRRHRMHGRAKGIYIDDVDGAVRGREGGHQLRCVAARAFEGHVAASQRVLVTADVLLQTLVRNLAVVIRDHAPAGEHLELADILQRKRPSIFTV